MAFQPAPQIVEIKLIMSQNSIPVVNVWNVDVGHSPTPSDLAAVIATFDAWLTADYAALIHQSVLFVDWVATDMSVFGGVQSTVPCTTPHGAITTAAGAANGSMVVSYRTGHSGRSFRGRTYIPGVPAAAYVDAQHLDTGYVTPVHAAFTALIAALNLASQTLVVLSRWTALALRAIAVATEITTLITDTKVDSQRRRTAN